MVAVLALRLQAPLVGWRGARRRGRPGDRRVDDVVDETALGRVEEMHQLVPIALDGPLLGLSRVVRGCIAEGRSALDDEDEAPIAGSPQGCFNILIQQAITRGGLPPLGWWGMIIGDEQ